MSDNSDQSTSWWKKLGTLFVGPFAFIFTVLAIILGAIGGDIVSYFNTCKYAYAISAGVVGGAYILIIFVTIIISVIIFSKDRNKEISQIIQIQPEVCKDIQHELSSIQQVVANLRKTATKSEIEKFIVSGAEVDELEASVKIDMGIIIFTSKFILEQKPNFVEIINCNFRKGVKYTYLVSNDDVALEKYRQRVKGWYKAFSEFTQSQEKANATLTKLQNDMDKGQGCNQNYTDLVNQAIGAFQNSKNKDKKAKEIRENKIKEIRENLKNMFKEQLPTYKLDKNLFFVTVAMYELETGNWKAIIKLPTENQEENFTAFCVSDANEKEKEAFIDNILHLRLPENQYQLPDEIFQ